MEVNQTMENNNKKTIIVCATIFACVLIICITIAILFTSSKGNLNTSSAPTTNTSQENQGSLNATDSTKSSSANTSSSNGTQNAGFESIVEQVKDGSLLIAPRDVSNGKSLCTAYKDINGDGNDELFLGYENTWWALYTLQNDQAKKIVQKESVRDSLTLRDDNTILRVKTSSDGEDIEHYSFSIPTNILISGRVDDDTGDGATLLFHAEKNHDRDDWYPEYEIGIGASDRDCSQAEYDDYLQQMNVSAPASALNWTIA